MEAAQPREAVDMTHIESRAGRKHARITPMRVPRRAETRSHNPYESTAQAETRSHNPHESTAQGGNTLA